MRSIEIFEFAKGAAFFRCQEREYRVRLSGTASGYVWIAPLDPETGIVLEREERQAMLRGAPHEPSHTPMWSGDKSARATIIRALEESGYRVGITADA